MLSAYALASGAFGAREARRRLVAPLVGVATACVAAQALAGEPSSPAATAGQAASDAVEAQAAPVQLPERTWLFVEEPQLPASLRVVAFSRATYSYVRPSGVSPDPADASTGGGVTRRG
jgi:hypothetical protein